MPPPKANAGFVAAMRRTNQDFAGVIGRRVDEWYSDAAKIVPVTDNLSTHTPAALYEAFEPAEARRLVEKLEWHYTPKHGRWLNVAEREWLPPPSPQLIRLRGGQDVVGVR